MKLIKTQDKFLLVNDEEIKEGEWMMFNSFSVPVQCTKNDGTTVYHKHGHYDTEGTLKVISENPDFSDLKEKDCKEIGWVDVEKLADNWYRNNEGTSRHTFDDTDSFIEGFKSAQSLNDKRFSLDDMRTLFGKTLESVPTTESHTRMISDVEYRHFVMDELFNRIIQSLQQTVWDVEVETWTMNEGYTDKDDFPYQECKIPKITNNSIKITKIL